VIVDQIEALAELNRIVARHGREFEVVEPAREPMRRVHEEQPARRPADEPTMRRAPEEPARRGPDAPSIARRPDAPPPRPVARPEQHASAPPIAPQPQPQPQRRPETPAPGAAAPPANQGQGNWLSDLLNRASQTEPPQPRNNDAKQVRQEERPTRHTIESLDSLSVDIARMIDHDAAAELWDRYNRGERNVFTRRLYTMQGQKAFDEIRRRYRADREFKQTVDRYIAEFERLLEEVSRDDRGQVVVRTYLTSETGKVYTMLAHAAGRIE
jgi:hypothetical protein